MTENLFIGCNGHVSAIEPSSGKELWRTQLSTTVTSSFVTAGEDVTVLSHSTFVFAGCNGHLFCLDAASGAVLWHNELEGLGHNDITLAIAGKSVQLVVRREEIGVESDDEN